MKNVKTWVCRVCGYVHVGREPPEECPQCSSSSAEFLLKKEKKKPAYDGRKLDVLLVNGSTHSGHNSGMLAALIEKELGKKRLAYRRVNLNELNVLHCWCCYSMRDSACTYPCRNQLDDMPVLHEMLLNSRAAIVVSPINWNNMSARLKDFLDRLTCIENLPLLGKKSPTVGKLIAIVINGHEDGAAKTMMDIFLYFQQMGFVMPPFGFAYRTHGGAYNAGTDNEFLAKDAKLKKDIVNLVGNISEMLGENLEGKLKGRIKPVCE